MSAEVRIERATDAGAVEAAAALFDDPPLLEATKRFRTSPIHHLRGHAGLAAAPLARRPAHPGHALPQHLRENLRALELQLDADELAA